MRRDMRIGVVLLTVAGLLTLVGCGHTLKPRPVEGFEETETGWHDDERGKDVYDSREVKGMRLTWDVERE